MDEGLVVAIIVLGFFLIIAGSLVIHEVLETPYDKCLDECHTQYDHVEIFLECVKDCNINANKNGEGG